MEKNVIIVAEMTRAGVICAVKMDKNGFSILYTDKDGETIKYKPKWKTEIELRTFFSIAKLIKVKGNNDERDDGLVKVLFKMLNDEYERQITNSVSLKDLGI